MVNYSFPKVIPGYRPKKPKTQIPWRIILLAIFFGALFLGLIYVLFLSPIFKIKDVELSVTTQVNHDQVLTLIKQSAIGKNIFFWDKSNIEKEIQNQYPLTADLLVYKGLPNTIKIVIQETTPKIEWLTGNKIYLIDDQGQVIKEGVNDQLIKVVDTKNLSINPGDRILPSFFINFLTDFTTQAQKFGLKIKNFSVSESLFDLTAVTDKNIRLILTPTRSAAESLNEYKQTIDKLGQPQQYIDLRFPNRAFVK
jgi:cell division septal protein FtsQ